MSVQEAPVEPVEQTAPRDGPASPSAPAENVERIREILFGPQIREYGQRFARIEERLANESAELKTELRRRLDSLEAYTRQELTDLAERLHNERGERADSVNRLSQTLADCVKWLERRLGESEERTAGDLRQLRQLTFDRIKEVVDDLTAQIVSTEDCQKRYLQELRGRSIDRLEFASLLTELALRMKGEFPATGLEVSDGGSKP